MPNRRRFLLAGAVLSAGARRDALAQAPRRPARVDFIGSFAPDAVTGAALTDPDLRAFLDELRTLGFLQGRNLAITWRSTAGNVERVPDLLRDALARGTDVIVASGGPAAWAAHRATPRVPVVGIVDDVLDLGIVDSLAQPGHNFTGVGESDPAIHGKRLQLLREIAPATTRVGVMCYTQGPNDGGRWRRELDAAGRSLGVATTWFAVDSAADLEPAIAAITQRKVDALYVTFTHVNDLHAARIAAFALDRRLPSIGFPDAGMLLGYWASNEEMHRRAAAQVAQILRGVPPGSIAFEQPTQFEFIINEKTARALGLAIPPQLRLRATRIVA